MNRIALDRKFGRRPLGQARRVLRRGALPMRGRGVKGLGGPGAEDAARFIVSLVSARSGRKSGGRRIEAGGADLNGSLTEGGRAGGGRGARNHPTEYVDDARGRASARRVSCHADAGGQGDAPAHGVRGFGLRRARFRHVRPLRQCAHGCAR